MIYEEVEAHLREFGDIRNCMRVKIEAKRYLDDKIAVKEIRLLPNNEDDDVEIEAEIQGVNVGKSSFTIGTNILVVPRPRSPGTMRQTMTCSRIPRRFQ